VAFVGGINSLKHRKIRQALWKKEGQEQQQEIDFRLRVLKIVIDKLV
jgi:hypothetical protein